MLLEKEILFILKYNFKQYKKNQSNRNIFIYLSIFLDDYIK